MFKVVVVYDDESKTNFVDSDFSDVIRFLEFITSGEKYIKTIYINQIDINKEIVK